jgi:NhaP-type Na+/H+ or K+/H+ antiporter
MQIDVEVALAAVGLLLILGATASGLAHRTILSLTVLATATGALLVLVGLAEVEPGSQAIVVVVELVLLLTLFADGLLVEQGLLRRHWSPAVRALVIAMPLTAVLLALAAKLLYGELSWAEAFLLGFLLSPTDPVVTSSIVASERVPQVVRHTLNLESGLNDGLALPFVLLFLALSEHTSGDVLAAAGALSLESVVGVAAGIGWGLAAATLLGRLPDWAITDRYEGLILLGTGLSGYGIAELAHGNGLIAAFVAGVAFALLRREAPEVFHRRNENITNVLHLIAFAIFGALVVEVGYNGELPALVAFVAFALLVARPAAVLVAFAGVRLATAEKLFVAWFGPKGIASMLFALFVLDSTAPDHTRLFEIAAFTILASIIAHGLTDTVAAARIEGRLEQRS